MVRRGESRSGDLCELAPVVRTEERKKRVYLTRALDTVRPNGRFHRRVFDVYS